MSKRKHPIKKRIPEFTTYEEEARFWDAHDTTEFEDEFKPVRVRVAKKLSDGITVQLKPETLRKVRVGSPGARYGPDHAHSYVGT